MCLAQGHNAVPPVSEMAYVTCILNRIQTFLLLRKCGSLCDTQILSKSEMDDNGMTSYLSKIRIVSFMFGQKMAFGKLLMTLYFSNSIFKPKFHI